MGQNTKTVTDASFAADVLAVRQAGTGGLLGRMVRAVQDGRAGARGDRGRARRQAHDRQAQHRREPAVARDYQIMSIPTMAVFRAARSSRRSSAPSRSPRCSPTSPTTSPELALPPRPGGGRLIESAALLRCGSRVRRTRVALVGRMTGGRVDVVARPAVRSSPTLEGLNTDAAPPPRRHRRPRSPRSGRMLATLGLLANTDPDQRRRSTSHRAGRPALPAAPRAHRRRHGRRRDLPRAHGGALAARRPGPRRTTSPTRWSATTSPACRRSCSSSATTPGGLTACSAHRPQRAAWLPARLRAAVDGICGPATLRALRQLGRKVVGGRPQLLREMMAVVDAGPSLIGKRIVDRSRPRRRRPRRGRTASVTEADIVLDLATRLEGRLAALGVTAWLTRGRQCGRATTERAPFANAPAPTWWSPCTSTPRPPAGQRHGDVLLRRGSGLTSTVGERFAGLVQREVVARTGLLDGRTHAKTWELLRDDPHAGDPARARLPLHADDRPSWSTRRSATPSPRRCWRRSSGCTCRRADPPTGVLRLPAFAS